MRLETHVDAASVGENSGNLLIKRALLAVGLQLSLVFEHNRSVGVRGYRFYSRTNTWARLALVIVALVTLHRDVATGVSDLPRNRCNCKHSVLLHGIPGGPALGTRQGSMPPPSSNAGGVWGASGERPRADTNSPLFG